MIKFADEATITVASGSGGDGCIAFRREKYVPMGGPAGGDGGKGGDVVFVVKHNVRTLSFLRYRQTFKAQNGLPGMGRNMHGKDGEDVIIPVPPGTIVKDAETGEIVKDFSLSRLGKSSGNTGNLAGKDGERWVFLSGGKGGWGNTHFKNSVNQAPRFAMPGQTGQERKLKIELSLIADVGLVGFPNAGKSSLLNAFTNARPKIASYPFTTKIPNLGVLTIHERDIILADIPGIIEGAHEGVGLGVRFLKHISRTSFLAFLVDLSDENWRQAYPVLLEELSAFSPMLAAKKRILIATKLDLPEALERYEEFKALNPAEEVLGISVFSGLGLAELKDSIFRQVTAEETRLTEADEAAVEPIPGDETLKEAGGEDLFNMPDEDLLG
ncbi:MAG: GTPase ObgE [Spirochaetales bacterium]|nr:GTPase ObgE [Spirochaetales bacterium]